MVETRDSFYEYEVTFRRLFGLPPRAESVLNRDMEHELEKEPTLGVFLQKYPLLIKNVGEEDDDKRVDKKKQEKI
jgi:hypothetical protein